MLDMLRREIRFFVLGFLLVTISALIVFHHASNQKSNHREIFIEPISKAKPIKGEKYDETLSKKLFNEVKVACMVNTIPTRNVSAYYIERTWGRRCNKLVFLSSKPVFKYETIVVPLNESREIIWQKVVTGFEYMYKHYINEYDWFFKGDEDKLVLIFCNLIFKLRILFQVTSSLRTFATCWLSITPTLHSFSVIASLTKESTKAT